MLDELNEICKEYHLVGFGFGLLAMLFLVHLFRKDVVGRWKWQDRRKKR